MLYVERRKGRAGANMMFRWGPRQAGQPAGPQAAGEDTVAWRRGEFSFELLGGPRDTGDALFAQRRSRRPAHRAGRDRARSGRDEREASPAGCATGRDGAALPGGTWLRLRLRVLAASGAPPVRLGWDDARAAAASGRARARASAGAQRCRAGRPPARRPAPAPTARRARGSQGQASRGGKRGRRPAGGRRARPPQARAERQAR